MFASTLARSVVRSFARSNGSGGVTSKEPLPLERIRQAAPSIFAGDRHGSRSEKYTYIPTSQIVEHLLANGFGVFSASQSGSREEDRRGHTKHMIRFRRLDQQLTVGGTHPEIVLVNSHDGSSAYRLMAGLYRLVCSNGLIVAANVIEDIRVHHKGNILQGVAEGVEQIARQLPAVTQSIEAMQALTLSTPEQEAFARAALMVKYDDAPPITEAQALTVRRGEDAAPTLWNTLNRVQETLIKGGDRYKLQTARGRQNRRTQPANSVDGQTRINRAVWQLAEEMRKIKVG